MNKCETCGRVDADIGTCGSDVTCPHLHGQPAPEVTDKDVVLRCGPCDVTRAVPAVDVLTNTVKHLDMGCPRGKDNCECRSVNVHSADDAPELTDQNFDQAAFMQGDTVIRPAAGTLTGKPAKRQPPKGKAPKDASSAES